MTNLDSILKSRANTLPTKVRLVKAMVFPVVMYGCESWTIESWVLKDWCFWTVVLEATLESSLDRKDIKPVNPKGNQVLNIHWKDWCWSWNSNTLATWCEEMSHWKWRNDSLEKTLMLGNIEGRRKGCQRTKWLDGITDSMDMSLSKLREIVRRRQWQPTPVLLPGKSHGWRSLVGCSPWGR